jgi:hypothetical protein
VSQKVAGPEEELQEEEASAVIMVMTAIARINLMVSFLSEAKIMNGE